MAPYPRICSRDIAPDNSNPNSNPNKITPVAIVGIALAGSALFAICLWLGIRAYRKRSRQQRENEKQSAFLTVKGVISESDEKADLPRRLTASIVMPQQNIIRPDVTKDEILHYHIANGTMTRPFSNTTNSSTLAPPPSNIPPHALTGGSNSKRSSFFNFTNRPVSTASTFSAASSILGVQGRMVRQLFAPVLPDELVLSLGEKVTVVKSFDDGWCIVGRESVLKPEEVEMGAVPAWCFVKPVKGLKASRPMRTTSLGVTVQLDAGPGFSSRDELISWSNF
ncbi:hypothetical protein B0F90DRAFT_1809421 [Multifurca ochricompacta]|uniref:SH3 domain-containing protein n=1 Tax=Multifurca ochricompacta TaxID=376703 RepID=A0AAD4QMD0_9AGAM|nr:hypothetical protein B0F90DRAFT_1809421 [Multifurca ochricompacta]